jgi:O2-independent ubiquinone biosynthesis protein UbiV
MASKSITLTIGPVLFNWPAEFLRDFYFRIADEAPVDHVCVGEVVCSRRQPLFDHVLAEVVERLERGGKTVLLSSLALPTLDRELVMGADLATGSHMVEANDVSALRALAHRPHAIGPFINVYNGATAAFLESRGATRITVPTELPADSIEDIAAAAPDVAIEVWAFGRIPLAISARCYHARFNGRTKDSCQFACDQDPDGLDVTTIDDQKFLAVNGVQTLSHTYCGLICELAQLQTLGVAALRLSPHTCDMVAVAHLFRGVIDGRHDPIAAMSELQNICPDATFSNGYLHGDVGAAYMST